MGETRADIPYTPDRIGLLPYEDRIFNAFVAAIPDYYTHPNDQSTFGKMLRSFAKEQARLEYSYQASMLAHSQRFQSPPDLKRNYAQLLHVDRKFPYAGSSDLDYRTMILKLIEAYAQGATPAGMRAVIDAYTSYPTVVQEGFKRIADGTGDVSDRNTLYVSIQLPSVLT